MEPRIYAEVLVSEYGYEWCGEVLKPKKGPDEEAYRRYDPFAEEPALFQIFADLESTSESICGFADQYGELYDNAYSYLEEWGKQISLMRSAIDLWSAVRTKDQKTLKRYLFWSAPGRLELSPSSPCDLWAYKCILQLASEGAYRRGDLAAPATDLLVSVIRSNASMLNVNLKKSSKHPLEFGIEATSLRTVIWLQLAVAVIEDKQFRRCELCGRPFELSPKVNRVDRVFCSDNCRVKSYQRRQATARKMRASGAKLVEIAKVVESSVPVVKRWLGEDK